MGYSIDLLVWLLIGGSTLISGFLSLKMYKKLPINPYIYQAFALWTIALFGFTTFYGFYWQSLFLIQVAQILLLLGIQIYLKFFRLLLGTLRHYEFAQIIAGIAFGFFIREMIINPPILFPTTIIMTPMSIIGAYLIDIGFFLVVGDYCVISIQKIRSQNLPLKLGLFSFVVLLSLFSMAIPFYLYQIRLIPIYVPFIVQCVLVNIMLLILLQKPSVNFLALVNPHLLTIIHKSGVPLFSYKFQSINEEQLFGGALFAITQIFKETIDQQGIEHIKFQGKVIYFNLQQDFFVVYMDDTYMPLLAGVVKEFGETIAFKYGDRLDEWNGDVTKLDVIKDDMKRVFYFLPQLIE